MFHLSFIFLDFFLTSDLVKKKSILGAICLDAFRQDLNEKTEDDVPHFFIGSDGDHLTQGFRRI